MYTVVIEKLIPSSSDFFYRYINIYKCELVLCRYLKVVTLFYEILFLQFSFLRD